jgi:hypothetical protein
MNKKALSLLFKPAANKRKWRMHVGPAVPGRSEVSGEKGDVGAKGNGEINKRKKTF